MTWIPSTDRRGLHQTDQTAVAARRDTVIRAPARDPVASCRVASVRRKIVGREYSRRSYIRDRKYIVAPMTTTSTRVARSNRSFATTQHLSTDGAGTIPVDGTRISVMTYMHLSPRPGRYITRNIFTPRNIGNVNERGSTYPP